MCMKWRRARERKRASVRRWEGEKRRNNEMAKGKRRKKLKRWQLECLKRNKRRALIMIIKNAMEAEKVKDKVEEDNGKEKREMEGRGGFRTKKIPELPTLMAWVQLAFDKLFQ